MKNFWHNLWRYGCYLVLAISLSLGTLHLFKADLLYETDIARDMLLLEDMLVAKKITLIGGRSSIPGVFHGPLYYWLAFPFFALSGGNPVVVSYFWLLLYWAFLASFYWVGRKVFNRQFALVSTTLMATLTTYTPKGFTHATVAIFLIIPLLYLVYRYLQTGKLPWLIATVLTTGAIIQFQMAFGVPVAILLGVYLIYQIIKHRRFTHLLAALLILLPLSTFILFDLRHEFIQTRSALEYFQSDTSTSLGGYWHDRFVSFIDAYIVFVPGHKLLSDLSSILTISALLFLAWKTWRTKNLRGRGFLLLIVLISLGFWLATAPFQGNIWPFYYRTLWPVIVFGLTYVLLNLIPKKIGGIGLAFLLAANIWAGLDYGRFYWHLQATDDEIHWKFYRTLATDLIADSRGQKFGYFVYSPDLYAYQGKYALHYFVRKNKLDATSYEKQPLTYLVVALDNSDSLWMNETYWRRDLVKIDREADRTWSYPSGYKIWRFDLSAAEATVSANPDLLDGIQFR